jgi:hypothetical protein
MSKEEIRTFTRRFFEAWNNGKEAAMAAIDESNASARALRLFVIPCIQPRYCVEHDRCHGQQRPQGKKSKRDQSQWHAEIS